MELFGGESGAARVAIRRRPRTGFNVDVVAGFDLLQESTQKYVEDYIRKHKPFVIVMGPPCTAFANWSRMNRVFFIHILGRHRDGTEKSWQTLQRRLPKCNWMPIDTSSSRTNLGWSCSDRVRSSVFGRQEKSFAPVSSMVFGIEGTQQAHIQEHHVVDIVNHSV